jgi:hypothetical protein
MVLDRVRCLTSCYNVINTMLVVPADSFTSPCRTAHHVSVAYACSDDIRRKLQQLFANVMASILVFLRPYRHDPRCLRLAHLGHLQAILTSVSFQGSFDLASYKATSATSVTLAIVRDIISSSSLPLTIVILTQGSFSSESFALPRTEQL